VKREVKLTLVSAAGDSWSAEGPADLVCIVVKTLVAELCGEATPLRRRDVSPAGPRRGRAPQTPAVGAPASAES
jgi:hypothetical protein